MSSFQQRVIDANAGSLPGRVALVIPVSMRISTRNSSGGRGLHGWANAGDSSYCVRDLPVMDEAVVCKILCKALGKVVCDRKSCKCKATKLSMRQIRVAGEIMVREKTLLLRDCLRSWRAKVVPLQAAFEKVFRTLWKCLKEGAGFTRQGNWRRGITKYLYDKSARESERVVLEQLRRGSDAPVKRRKVVRLRYEQLVADLEPLKNELLAAKFHEKVLEESVLVMECFASGLVKMVRNELQKAGNTLVGVGRVLRGDIIFALRCDRGTPFNCRL